MSQCQVNNFVQTLTGAVFCDDDNRLLIMAPNPPYQKPAPGGGSLVLQNGHTPTRIEIITYSGYGDATRENPYGDGVTLLVNARGQEGTSAYDWPKGSLVLQPITATQICAILEDLSRLTSQLTHLDKAAVQKWTPGYRPGVDNRFVTHNGKFYVLKTNRPDEWILEPGVSGAAAYWQGGFDLSAMTTRIDALESRLSSLFGANQRLDADDVYFVHRLFNAGINDVSGALVALMTLLNNLKTEIARVDNKVIDASDVVFDNTPNLGSGINNLDKAIGAIKGLIDDLQGRVNSLQVSVNAWNVPDATTALKGKVELATTAEARAGTDTRRVVTPAGLQAFHDNNPALPSGFGTGIGTEVSSVNCAVVPNGVYMAFYNQRGSGDPYQGVSVNYAFILGTSGSGCMGISSSNSAGENDSDDTFSVGPGRSPPPYRMLSGAWIKVW